MKQIRLTGKERTVIRGIGFALGCSGEELLEHTRLEADMLLDLVNAMIDAGYVETTPYCEKVAPGALGTTTFEVNPGYAHALREAIGKSV